MQGHPAVLAHPGVFHYADPQAAALAAKLEQLAHAEAARSIMHAPPQHDPRVRVMSVGARGLPEKALWRAATGPGSCDHGRFRWKVGLKPPRGEAGYKAYRGQLQWEMFHL